MHAEIKQQPGWGQSRDAFGTKVYPILAHFGEASIGGQKGISEKTPMKIDDHVRAGIRIRKIFLMRDVGSQPARGQPCLRFDAHITLCPQNLTRSEYVFFRDQQIDVTGVAQGGVLERGNGKRKAFENPEIDLSLAKAAANQQ